MTRIASHWQLEADGVDPTSFFALLPRHFPEATTLYIEGSSLAADVRAVLTLRSAVGEYLPDAETIWPKSPKFRCAYSVELCEELSRLSAHHAVPELLDHLHLYAGDQVLLYWPDAFMNELVLAPTLPEARVRAFAAALGVRYLHRAGT